LKYLGQKAFISYTRSIYLQKDKEVFNFDELDLDGFAASLGLPGAPQIKYQKGEDIKRLKNAPRAMLSDSDDDSDGEGGKGKKDQVRTKYQKMAERQNQDVLSSHYRKLLDGEEDNQSGDDEEADFLSVKRVLDSDAQLDAAAGGDRATTEQQQEQQQPKVVKLGNSELVIDSHRREKLLKSKKKLAKYMDKGSKLVFDDDGNAHPIYELQGEEDFEREGPAEQLRREFVEAEMQRVQEADVTDKQLAKQRRKEKRERQKARERGEEVGAREEAVLPQLAVGEEDGEGEDPLALLRSLPVSGGHADDDDNDDGSAGGGSGGEKEEEEEERPRKKARKWFQDDSDEERRERKKKKGGKKVIEMDHEPDNLQDLEALAAGLLED
jgi:ATP-dependent RNA helicase DDX10/DBP4